MNYNYHQIARAEYEERNRSLQPVYDAEFQIHNRPVRRVSIRWLHLVLTMLINLLVKQANNAASDSEPWLLDKSSSYRRQPK